MNQTFTINSHLEQNTRLKVVILILRQTVPILKVATHETTTLYECKTMYWHNALKLK